MTYQLEQPVKIKPGVWMYGGKTGKLKTIRDDYPHIYGVLMDCIGERRWFSVDELEEG